MTSKNARRRNKRIARFLVLLTVLALTVSAVLSGGTDVQAVGEAVITQLDNSSLIVNTKDYLDGSVVYQLPDTISSDQTVSLIVQVQSTPILDVYTEKSTNVSFTEYAVSQEASEIRQAIADEKAALLHSLDEAGIAYATGADYSVLLSGFELKITAADFQQICRLFEGSADVYISEAYEKAQTEVVENYVDVYSTGIFDSSDFGYDGTGIVVAVLDTGIDYDHTAFSLENFTADRSRLGLTYDEVAALVGQTKASTLVDGLTAADVYVNEKIPYAFDYADSDSDAYPINSDHGTHVSGIIAGNDDEITGVAPNAQLVEMKIFSDVYESAMSSWILSAVEDCVVLGVDVINMSIGTACGFARESDEELLTGVYQKILDHGISLVVAASNSYNSTYGSEKNGNLGLTSNPDSGTVGSPSTYDSAMSVASVSGVKTPYLVYNDTIIYFTESVDRVQEEKNFVEELLDNGTQSVDMEYILIPGAGRSADYTGLDVTGKLVLVARGSTTFEEKAQVAEKQGAAGLIIYNNVSGDIKMNVGDAAIPVCSISQDDGEVLAAAGSGTLTVSVEQTAGPFMSDFSSWGPSPSLQIKPEITAHGGSIYSCVPGQSYDRISGTSMACPNVSGITALLRQYVKENFPEIADDSVAVTTMVNRLMMSTADILLNTNGNPYSVRKQGAGNANLNNCAATTSYIITYDKDGSQMTKTKIELGDDAEKKGVYVMSFDLVNFGSTSLSYDLSAYVMTEGVSDTKTSHGETTVSEEAYILEGASVEITDSRNASVNGMNITVEAGTTASVTVTVTLGEEDKAYLESSFENGMYVEGYIVLNAEDEDVVDLSVPYLAFYGDWTQAPIFDLDYYETNPDELDTSLDDQDKTMPDAYATRPIGGIYSDYVSYLGSFYFVQDPFTTQVPASREHIALSNQEDTINSLSFVWAGLLRNCATVEITITDDATGDVVFQRTETDVRKSYGDGGSIYPSNIDVGFSAIENDLKNNTRYTVNLTAYVDYGDGGEQTNVSNTFEFPLYIDFEAPTLSDAEFYTEYDSANKEMRYFVKAAVYDNHYSMAMQMGYVSYDANQSAYILNAFDQYLTPVYSDFNTTSYVVYELTDHINELRENANHTNTVTVALYDYALNYATYEIELPDDFLDITFGEEEIVISPNQVVELDPLIYPENQWSSLLEYYCTVPAGGEVARVVNNKLVGVSAGSCVVVARDTETKKQTTIKVTVLGEEDEGYVRYDKPVVDQFELTGYYVNKAYYFLSSEDQELGSTGDNRKFHSDSYYLSMYPSESVTLQYILDAYFPNATSVTFESSNENIVTVDQTGTITAVAEGFGSVSMQVVMDGRNTYYSKSITITVKDPYSTTGASLTNYYGLGGDVVIPESLSLTSIGNFAFSNYTYVDKTEEEYALDDSSKTKQTFIGDDTITSVVIPEGVTSIGEYAFANLTSLTTVILPSTIERIDQYAFYGCTSLVTVDGLENVKFLNRGAFENCSLKGSISLDNCVAMADRVFCGNTNLTEVTLSSATRSVGGYAFYGCTGLEKVTVNAANVKIGPYIFANCSSLTEITLNTAVVAKGAFYGCDKLETVNLGADVSYIAEYAFGKSAVSTLNFDSANPNYKLSADGRYVTNAAGTELVLVMPCVEGSFTLEDPAITSVGISAFAGNTKLTEVNLPFVTQVGDYAFAECSRLRTAVFGDLTQIGDYAFYGCALQAHHDLTHVDEIGSHAYAQTKITTVEIPDGTVIGEGAFYNCDSLKYVAIGNDVTIGNYAFALDADTNWTFDFYTEDDIRYYYYIYTSPLHSLSIGSNAQIGEYAFCGASELTEISLGGNAVIGNYAFYNCSSLTQMDLSDVASIGEYAFSGDMLYMANDSSFTQLAVDKDDYYMYTYHAPQLTDIDLSSADSVGRYAFAYCRALETVALGSQISELPEGVFYGCSDLKNVELNDVVSIGSYCFSESALTEADLTGVETVGDYAFYNCPSLKTVKFNPNGSTLGEAAFAYCAKLSKLNNEEFVTSVGDYAFGYTAVTKADLSAAQYIGTHAFIKEELTPFTVTLGSALTGLGDNPFALCDIPAFSQSVVTTFNGVDYTADNLNFTISDTVCVIDGSLYQTVPSGLELVTFAGNEKVVEVAENTVRISAMAFAGSDAEQITLPHTVAAIGHKAFYGCDDLIIVTFGSYDAPVLEEEYDYMYFSSGKNISGSGAYTYYESDGFTEVEFQGLGVTDYFMWNATDNPTNIYYGANFVDYIGHHDAQIIMVRPVNGQNYDSFIWAQYFSNTVDGAAAADKTAQAAIDAINALPATVSLSDKSAVEAARKAYDLISTAEQRALVTNYSVLTQAEKRISDLEFLESEQATSTEPTEEPGDNEGGSSFRIILAVVLIAAAAVIALIATRFAGKTKQASDAQSGDEADSASEDAESSEEE